MSTRPRRTRESTRHFLHTRVGPGLPAGALLEVIEAVTCHQQRVQCRAMQTLLVASSWKSSWNFEWFTKDGPSTHVQKGV